MDIEKYLKPDLTKARKRTKEKIETVKFNLDENLFNLGVGKKYEVLTFGCQGNEADSETISGILELLGYTKTNSHEDADIIIVNTCAIRENAEAKIWGLIGSFKTLKEKKPGLIVGLCGCMPQEEKTVNLVLQKYKHIDIVFGTHNIHLLPEYIKNAMESNVVQVYSTPGIIVENLPKVRENAKKAWVNIMFGCDEFCTYCIVPYTRGQERSRKHEDIINEVKDLVNKGYVEVTLLGQNVNSYGLDLHDGYTFGNLLYDLDKTGIKRIRFTTSHPKDFDDLTINAFRDCKSVMPHLHLPVQSGSNSILKKMNRKYTKEEYLEKINKLKAVRPDISITTDIIVAFPSETEEDFNETLDLVDKVGFEGAFTFIYSKREGTPAARMENLLTEEEKHQRLNILQDKINEGYLKGNMRFLNKTVKVLVDGTSKNDDNILSGYTEHNKLVNFKGDKELIGSVVDVKITEAKTWFLLGEAVNE